MRSLSHRLLWMGGALGLLGCAPGADLRPEQTAQQEVRSEGLPESEEPPPASANEWAVTPEGAGEVRIGSSLEAVRPLLATMPDSAAIAGECSYLPFRNAPEGMLFMFEGGVLVRIDVISGSTPTVEGAAIGDTEARIRSLYPRVERSPHKYTDGSYLIDIPLPPADTLKRTVFETDGQRVSRYRAGLFPAVQYVEGCG